MTEGEAASCHSMRQMCEVISALGPCWEGECVCPFAGDMERPFRAALWTYLRCDEVRYRV